MFNKFRRQFNAQALSKYFRNTSWMLFERFFRLGLAAFVGIYVARYLGVEKYGELNYAISYVSIFGAVASLGLRNILLRELSNTSNQDQKLTSTALALHLFGSLSAVLIIYLLTYHTSLDGNYPILTWIIALMLPFQAFLVIDIYFQAKVLAKFSSWAQMSSVVAGSVYKVYLILSGGDLVDFAWAIVAENALLAFILLAMGNRHKTIKASGIDRELMPDMLKNGFFFLLASVATTIYMKIDQVMLKEIVGFSEAGLYAGAVRFSEAFYFLPVIIANSLSAAIANLQKESYEKYLKRIQQLYDLMAWSAITIAIAISFSAEWIIDLCLKEDFAPSAPILVIHIWAAVFVFLGVAHDKWLLQEKLYKLAMWKTLSGAIANVILNLVLIEKYGGMGAAYATVFSYMLGSYLINAVLPHSRKAFYMQTKAFFLPFRLILQKFR